MEILKFTHPLDNDIRVAYNETMIQFRDNDDKPLLTLTDKGILELKEWLNKIPGITKEEYNKKYHK